MSPPAVRQVSENQTRSSNYGQVFPRQAPLRLVGVCPNWTNPPAVRSVPCGCSMTRLTEIPVLEDLRVGITEPRSIFARWAVDHAGLSRGRRTLAQQC